MPLTITIALYFAAAVAVAFNLRRSRVPTVIASVPFAAQLIVVMWLAVTTPGPDSVTFSWVPSLGLTFDIVTSPLTLLLVGVVAGIGLLIVVYSSTYFTESRRRNRFLAFLTLFTGGMVGLVASGDLFGLFVFWEVTTVASFLLIGFDTERAAARAAATQAVLVTTGGGLALLAGIVIIRLETQTTSLAELAANPPTGTAASVALVLVLLGAFTKSAQVPFHFWLPGAMAAPTPASAFLHSASMVKAGVILLIFFEPVFGTESLWELAVTGVGLVTMAVGALSAIRQVDAKLLLAHGTVSQLGFMVALVGLGFTGAAVAVLVAHAVFKSGLFLVVGAVDQATGTRDIRELSGVGRAHRVLASAGAAVAMSMAGVPPMLGFVTKEAAFDQLWGSEDWTALIVVVAASTVTVAYTIRFWVGLFGTKPARGANRSKPIARGMLIGPVILGVISVALGTAPWLLGDVLASTDLNPVKLVLWPGLKPALGLSAGALAAGYALYVAIGRPDHGLPRVPSIAQRAYESTMDALAATATRVTGVVQNGSLPVYIAVIAASVVAVPLVVWVSTWDTALDLKLFNSPAEVALALVMIAGAITATRVQRRLAGVLMLGVVGYSMTGLFVLFGAPDLALTQLLVETLTVAMFVFVLIKLPRRFGDDPESLSKRTRVVVSVFVGGFVSIAALITASIPRTSDVSDDYLEGSVDAGGENVVNVILTNYRALDTLGEIAVLAAAAIGISILVTAPRRRRAADEAGA